MPAVFPTRNLARWKAWDNGARQRASAYWRKHIESDPTLERAYVVVELMLGGRTVFLARDTLTATRGSTGERVNYAPGLSEEPAVHSSVGLGNQAASARSVSIEIPAWILHPSETIANGQILAGVGEISVVLDGGDYDLRWVLLRGSVTGGLAFGRDAEFISVQLTDFRGLQERQIPPWIIDGTSWPSAQDAAVGQRIQRVYNGGTAIPAPRVLDDHGGDGLYFAACDTSDDFDIDTLYVNGEAKAEADATYEWSEETVQDGYGRRTLVADFSTSKGPWDDNDSVNITISRTSGVAAKGVLDIAKELLSEFTSLGLLGLNLDLFSYAGMRIEPTAPDVVINASGSDTPGVLSFVEGGLLSSYPMVCLAYSGAGLGAVVIDRRTGPGGQGITGKMEGKQFPLIERLSMYAETPKDEMFTDFELQYEYNPMDRSYGKVLTRNPDNSVACRIARDAIGGRRPYETIESQYIQSASEGSYVIDWLVSHRALPYYAVEWTCYPWVHLRHRCGDNVKYSDPDFPIFTDTTATIVDLGFARGQHTIAFLVWHPVLSLSFTAAPA